MEIYLVTGVDKNRGERFLKLNKSLYGLKQSIKNWFDLIKTGIERMGYHRSQFDPCVFYRKDSVILTYVDYCVIVSRKQ